MSTANTFGTFLETFKRLETGPDQTSQTSGVDLSKAILGLATILSRTGGSLTVKAAIAETQLPKDEFFTILGAGLDKKVFTVGDQPDDPVLTLTSLGRSLL
jgi:hypothetical protein